MIFANFNCFTIAFDDVGYVKNIKQRKSMDFASYRTSFIFTKRLNKDVYLPEISFTLPKGTYVNEIKKGDLGKVHCRFRLNDQNCEYLFNVDDLEAFDEEGRTVIKSKT